MLLASGPASPASAQPANPAQGTSLRVQGKLGLEDRPRVCMPGSQARQCESHALGGLGSPAPWRACGRASAAIHHSCTSRRLSLLR